MQKNILIYGMSNTISLIEYLTQDKPSINHQNYLDGNSEEIITFAKKIILNNQEFNIYYLIMNPKFKKLTGGFGYFHEGYNKFLINEPLNEIFKAEFQKINSNLITIGCINGNEHNIMGLTTNRFPNDFRGPEDQYLCEKRVPIQYEMIKNELRNKSLGTIELYKHLSALMLGSKNIIMQPPPPIKLDVDYVNIYNEGFREDAIKYGINEIRIRIKIFKTYWSILKELGSLGYEFIETPESIYVPDGMSKIYASGVTHGNKKYIEYLIQNNWLGNL
jgi:hypothetical protein